MNVSTNRPTRLSALGEGIVARWHSERIGAFNGNHLRFRVMDAAAADWHVHEASDELFLVLSGVVDLDTGHDTHTLAPGDLFVVPAGVRHRARVAGRATLLV